jgi:hypothetical protein
MGVPIHDWDDLEWRVRHNRPSIHLILSMERGQHPDITRNATPEGKMKVKIFESTWSGELGKLEKEINNFLATLKPGAVLNTQTAMAAVRNENDQKTEYVVTIWYD